jgi:acyl carrier protein
MSTGPDTAEILTWARGYLADLLGSDPAALDPHADFDQLGVDSALAVSLLMEIEGRYGVDVPPESLFENPTLAAVAAIVAAERAPA